MVFVVNHAFCVVVVVKSTIGVAMVCGSFLKAATIDPSVLKTKKPLELLTAFRTEPS